MSEPLIEQVWRTIQAGQLLQEGNTVLVGFSGGPDSTALLWILRALQKRGHWQIVAAHVDHRLRPESTQEAERAAQLADRLGIAFEGLTVPEEIARKGSSLEAEARKWRYHLLYSYGQQIGAQALALGHHLDDQVETVLERLFTGSALRGLGGMRLKRPGPGLWVIRPLLEVRRAQLQALVEAEGLPTITDASNADLRFLRNRLRHQLLPAIEAAFPNAVAAMGRTAALLRDEEAALQAQLVAWEGRLYRLMPDGGVLFDPPFRQLPLALQRRAIQLVWGQFATDRPLSAAAMDEVRALFESHPSARLALPEGIEAVRNYDELWLRHRQQSPQVVVHPLPENGEWIEPVSKVRFRITHLNGPPHEREDAIFVSDRWRQNRPLVVRGWQRGDRIHLTGGWRKLSDLFVDRKIPREQRDRLPLLCLGEDLLWVVPFAKDIRLSHQEGPGLWIQASEGQMRKRDEAHLP
ncbi:MAG: tRNA lysidine(34) synthetase TilS [Firmicutes bacterium]|nr:tRNA lysidine(34) synthetase TilS [Bacillota bacterium]